MSWIKLREIPAAAEGCAMITGVFTFIDCCSWESEAPHINGLRRRALSRAESVAEEVVVAAVDGEQQRLFVQ